jgi:DNA-directed RNA polymerase subunit alpha
MKKTLAELSRMEWEKEEYWGGYPGDNEIEIGCFQRMALANERMVEMMGLILQEMRDMQKRAQPEILELPKVDLDGRLDRENFTVRLANILRCASLDTYRQLLQNTESDLLKYRNFGKKSLEELKEHLEAKGLTLK